MTAFDQHQSPTSIQAIADLDWYVYYQVRIELAETVQSRVQAMQQRLRQMHGISCGLKRRPQEKDGLHTWMETYLAVPSDFMALLNAEVQTARLAELITGERHTEYFWDVTSCA